MNISIRQVGETDIPLLADIGRQTFCDAFKDNNSSQENFEKYLTEAFTEAKIRSEFEETTTLFLLAENDKGKALAYAKLRWDKRRDELMTNKNYMEVERIYVLKNYWRMGIGKLMMNEIFDLSYRLGYECLCLAVYEENTPALRFYEQLDFEQVGRVIFQLGDIIEYDILMMKKVDDSTGS